MVEVPPSRRTELVCELLREPERRPAIIYAPTRKHAEALAQDLSALFPVAEYHAGLDPGRRERVQACIPGWQVGSRRGHHRV